MSGLGPEPQHEHQVLVGKQPGNGWLAGTSVDASSVYGPILFVLALPFMAAHWLVDHVGWIELILTLVALVAVINYLAFHTQGRVIAARLSGLAVGRSSASWPPESSASDGCSPGCSSAAECSGDRICRDSHNARHSNQPWRAVSSDDRSTNNGSTQAEPTHHRILTDLPGEQRDRRATVARHQ